MAFKSGVKYERLREAAAAGALASLTEGTIRKNGTYLQCIAKYRGLDGKLHALSRNVRAEAATTGEREKRRILREWREALVEDLKTVGGNATDTSATVGDAMRQYVDSRLMLDENGEAVDLRKSTITLYRFTIKLLDAYPPLRDCALHDVTEEDVKAWVKAMASGTEDHDPWAKSTIVKGLTLLRATFKWAKVADPSRNVRMPKNARDGRNGRLNDGRPNRLTTEGVAHLNATLAAEGDTPITRAAYLGLNTGLRAGELCALAWEDVDLANLKVYVRHNITCHNLEGEDGKREAVEEMGLPKTASSLRSVMIASDFAEMLCGWREKDGGEGFVLRGGGRYAWTSPMWLAKRWQGFATKHSIEGTKGRIVLHDLRHTFASIHLEKGTPVTTISDMLGHTKISITLDRYCGSTEEAQREAVDRMASVFSAMLA